MEGEGDSTQLLKKKYNLHASPEAGAAAKRTFGRTGERVPQDPLANIANYLNRFREITDREDPQHREHGMEAAKRFLHRKYVIKPDEIPKSFWDNQRRIVRERGQEADLGHVEWEELKRHKDLKVIPKGAASAVPTKRELAAKKIDAEDYRGSSGSTFIELPGDIAILASGGGASLLVMDSLALAGGEAANYTEYSGNPPREKVEALTRVALDKEGLSGCLVSGAVANFTDIYETLGGFLDGLKKIEPKPVYPIVIRRGGPKQKEAYRMLEKAAKKEGFNIHLFGPETPISVASQKMVELSKEFKMNK